MKRIIALCALGLSLTASSSPGELLRRAQAGATQGKVITSPMTTKSGKRSVFPVLDKKPTRVPAAIPGRDEVPMRKLSSNPDLYGWVTYTINSEYRPGLFSVTGDGTEQLWVDKLYTSYSQTLQTGWLQDGVIRGYSPGMSGGMILWNSYVEYNFETGENTKCVDMEDGQFPFYNAMAYVPGEEVVYGYGVNMLDGSYVWQKNSCENMTATPEFIKVVSDDDEKCMSVGYCYADGNIYGVNAALKFVRIDTDGTQTEIMDLSGTGSSTYLTGLVWMPSKNAFYWNLVKTDDSSSIVKIDPFEKTYETLCNLKYDEELVALFTTDRVIDDVLAPQAPEISSVDFPNGALAGNLVLTMPESFAGGDPIETPLQCRVFLDGNLYGTYNAEAGKQVNVAFENLTEGTHLFEAQAVCDGHESELVAKSAFIGFDTPMAPANVKLAADRISWTPVTVGVNKGYIDQDNLVYIVKLNGDEIGSTSESSIAVEIPAEGDLRAFNAEVTAVCHGKTSAVANSNQFIGGAPLSMPVEIAPTVAQADICTYVDGNGNGESWFYSDDYECFMIRFTSEGDGPQDDWLITPPIAFPDASSLYTLAFDVSLRHYFYPNEAVEVYLGTSPDPDDMNVTLIERFQPAQDMETMNCLVVPEEAGTYYIGFRCVSAEHQYGVFLKNIKVYNDGVTSASPELAERIIAFPFEEGVLKADIQFSLPTKNISGELLDENLQLTAVVKAANEVSVEGKPGERVSATVETVQGMNKITVQVNSADGNGNEAYVNVYTGEVAPAPVGGLKCTNLDDLRNLLIEWEPVVTGEDGGYVNPENITYEIYLPYETMFGPMWTLYATVGKECSYTFTADEQAFYKVGVAAVNAGGASGVMVVSEVVGKPYALPLVDDFEGTTIDPLVTRVPSEDYDADWGWAQMKDIHESLPNPENYAIVATPSSETSKAMLGLPRFTTEGCENVKAAISVLSGTGCAPVKVLGFTAGMDAAVLVGEVPAVEGALAMNKYSFDLPESLIGKNWVELQLDVTFPSPYHIVVIDDYEVSEGKTQGCASAELAARTVEVVGQQLALRGFAGTTVSVASVSGQSMYHAAVSENVVTLTLNPGVYVVSADGAAHKVIVR